MMVQPLTTLWAWQQSLSLPKPSTFKLLVYNLAKTTLGVFMRYFTLLFISFFMLTACSPLQLPTHHSYNKQLLKKANILNNRGVDAYKKRNYKEAINYYLQSLAIKEKILGTEDLNTATSYNNLGLIYKQTKEYQKAQLYLSKALQIRERALGHANGKTAESYNNLGTLYASMGETQKAIQLTKSTIRIKQNIIVKERADTAISYTNLAVLEEIQGDTITAIKHHKKALQINKEIYGEEHVVTQNNYKNIAQLYFALQQYQKAREYASHIVKTEPINLRDINIEEKYR